jgi:hypothetical protein
MGGAPLWLCQNNKAASPGNKKVSNVLLARYAVGAERTCTPALKKRKRKLDGCVGSWGSPAIDHGPSQSSALWIFCCHRPHSGDRLCPGALVGSFKLAMRWVMALGITLPKVQ